LKNGDASICRNAEGERKWAALARFPLVSMDWMLIFLDTQYYPGLYKGRFFTAFAQTFELPEDVQIQNIEGRYVTAECFQHEAKYQILNCGMGSGKTMQTIERLYTEPNVVWVSANIALAENTVRRITGDDWTLYNEVRASEKEKGALNTKDKVMTCINSLHYMQMRIRDDVLVIDEIETLLDKFLDTSFMQHKRLNWLTLVRMFRDAKKVILLDAFITTKTINFIRAIEGSLDDVVVFRCTELAPARTVHYKESLHDMIEDIITKFQDGKKVFLYYPYKKENNKSASKSASSSNKAIISSMRADYNAITERAGKDAETDGVIYNGAESQAVKKRDFKDVNKAWANEALVVTNNVITCGINYENSENPFEYVYLISAPFTAPRDLVQVSYRPRLLTENKIYVYHFDGYANTTNQTTFETWITVPFTRL
jgi:hypothetical protein